jgi:hypothetical protein
VVSAQADVGRMNCAGQSCPERKFCRRYQVFIPTRGYDREHPHGAWGSFDIERQKLAGECRAFVQFRGNR